jgi:hypothetical protein
MGQTKIKKHKYEYIQLCVWSNISTYSLYS